MTDHPGEAGVPRTSAPTRTYEGSGITVEWRADRCIHTALCLRALPSVFDTSAQPWVDVDGADPGAIAEAVRQCPTGALRYSGEGLPADDGGTARVALGLDEMGLGNVILPDEALSPADTILGTPPGGSW